MEDEDEFGDLYTDVLRPFSSSAPQPQHPSTHRSIDLNLHNDVDDDEILYGASTRNTHAPSDQPLSNSAAADYNLTGEPRVLNFNNAKLPNSASNTVGHVDFQSDKQDKEITFDIEEDNTGIIEDSGPMIPGITMDAEDSKRNEADLGPGAGPSGGGGGDEDWEEDSDSEDDLQIVLNDNNHGPMGMERGMIGDANDDDDDDEDGDPLVIVADGDPNQPMEEKDWGVGDDAAAAAGAEGEKKEGSEAAGKGSAVAGPKIGYSNHGYHHPFHSQFKYVRPGAAPMSGTTTVGPGGAPGQVRPSISMTPIAGRGRGDWRPAGIKTAPMQKGHHPGFGMPVWGNNMAGRGFGGGLEFTLPSHKTVFDVDIDSFEEKPWKYPGVDISDFFNFGLNEESWKDFCKQLEQHRLETTMQSKIRVYESGRTEQEYDPDMPPELAAAAGIHDIPVDNSSLGKSEVGQNDSTKGPARGRLLPTGRAIQVEGGYGERLPSIDTRPPRNRDSDAIIEIVCQDSLDDDSSTGHGSLDGANNGPLRDDFIGSHVPEEDPQQIETEEYDDFPQGYDSRKGGKRFNAPEGDGTLSSNPEAPSQYRSSSRGSPLPNGGDIGPSHEERRGQGRTRDRSPHFTLGQTTRDKRFLSNADDESVESMDDKQSPLAVSPDAVMDERELSIEEDKDVAVSDEHALAEGSSGREKDEMTENEVNTKGNTRDGNGSHSTKKQKLISRAEQSLTQEVDDGEDSKAARSSENSKARSGSSKDYQKWQDGVEDEVVQGGRARHTGSIKRHIGENEQNIRRKERDVKHEMERNHMVIRGREGSYPYRDMDPNLAHHLHMRNEGYDKRKERENTDGAWQRREEDPHNRKSRTEDTRKRERGDEIGSRHRSKIRESERSDKEEHLHSRKQIDNGSYRMHYDNKDSSSRHRERKENLKGRYDMVDDYHSKRRKDEEYLRREHNDKEEILIAHRETANRRRRERDDVLDPRKRDDQQRIRDNLEDYHSVRQKDEAWLQRERGERQREREDLYRLKQSHEENLSKREKEDGRGSVRTGRGADDKAWIGHLRMKDEYRSSDKEYQLKDGVRNSEQQKRRERMEDESYSHHRLRDDVYARGTQLSTEERRSRQDRSSNRIDRANDAPNNQRVHDRKYKDSTRSKESEGGDHNTLGSSRRNQEDQSGHIDEMGLKGSTEQGNAGSEMQHNASKRHKEEVSSDDEQQDSRRGRSKLERWTSHKERDYSIGNKPSTSLKFKEIERNNSVVTTTEGSKVPDVHKRVENHPSTEDKMIADAENKDNDSKPLEDRHLDTVEKLKKRSERFKLPMPSEKETVPIKKLENEVVPSVKVDAPVDSEVKPERPARKRRWISN